MCIRDSRLGGLHKSDLVIIAGRPSMGKTALATNIAFNAAKKIQENGEKSSVAFFSLEMSSEQLSTRILAEQTKISGDKMRKAELNKNDFNKIAETSSELENLIDADSTPVIEGPLVFATNYQGSLTGFSIQEGRPVLSIKSSSFHPPVIMSRNVVVIQDSGEISSLKCLAA